MFVVSDIDRGGGRARWVGNMNKGRIQRNKRSNGIAVRVTALGGLKASPIMDLYLRQRKGDAV